MLLAMLLVVGCAVDKSPMLRDSDASEGTDAELVEVDPHKPLVDAAVAAAADDASVEAGTDVELDAAVDAAVVDATLEDASAATDAAPDASPVLDTPQHLERTRQCQTCATDGDCGAGAVCYLSGGARTCRALCTRETAVAVCGDVGVYGLQCAVAYPIPFCRVTDGTCAEWLQQAWW